MNEKVTGIIVGDPTASSEDGWELNEKVYRETPIKIENPLASNLWKANDYITLEVEPLGGDRYRWVRSDLYAGMEGEDAAGVEDEDAADEDSITVSGIIESEEPCREGWVLRDPTSKDERLQYRIPEVTFGTPLPAPPDEGLGWAKGDYITLRCRFTKDLGQLHKWHSSSRYQGMSKREAGDS
jgi:hypothetical protein